MCVYGGCMFLWMHMWVRGCIPVQTCVHVCVCVHGEGRGWPSVLFLKSHLHYLLRNPTGLELIEWARLVGRWASDLCLSPHLSIGILSVHCQSWLLHRGSGDHTQTLTLWLDIFRPPYMTQAFVLWDHLSCHIWSLWKSFAIYPQTAFWRFSPFSTLSSSCH